MSTTLKMANGDLYINNVTGKAKTISGPEKVSQDIGEILLTLLIPDTATRSYTAFPRPYGSELAFIQTPLQYSGLVGEPLISKKIYEAIDRLKTYQRQDPNSTSSERIKTVTKLVVKQVNTSDFIFYLEVLLEGGTKLEMQRLVPTAMDHLAVRGTYTDDRNTPRIN